MLIRADLVFPSEPDDVLMPLARLSTGLMLVLFGMMYMLVMMPLNEMIAPKPMDWMAHSFVENA